MYVACSAYNHLITIPVLHVESRLCVLGQVPSLCWEGLSQTRVPQEQPFQMWFKWKPAWELPPPPTGSGWRQCILFHAVYSFEQIVSFTRHPKSVVANTCSHGECHLAMSATGSHTAPPFPYWVLFFPVRFTSCYGKGYLRKRLSPPQCPFHIPGPHTHSSAEGESLTASEGECRMSP